jgi:hypothetical protein
MLLVLIALPFLIYRDALPGSMATHWSLSGEPNGSMPPLVGLSLLGGIFVAMVYSVHRVLRRTPEEGPSLVAGLLAVGALLAGVSWMSVLANRDRASWDQADEVGVVQIGLLLAITMIVGFAGWMLAGGNAPGRTRSGGVAPTLDVADPGSAVWSGRGSGKVLTGLGLVAIVVGVVLWGWSALVLVLIGLVILAFSEVRVTVGPHGAVVSLGWWGFPSWTVPMASIVRAEVETVSPMAYGGWGYRLRPGVRAIIVRGGESLRLVRDDAPDLVLTVDDATTGAGLINAMLATPTS